MTLVRRAADRLVGMLVPHAEAGAAPCAMWSSYCFCRDSSLYYLRRDHQFRSCGCHIRYRAPGGCA